jgi:hypothetical protein
MIKSPGFDVRSDGIHPRADRMIASTAAFKGAARLGHAQITSMRSAGKLGGKLSGG